jgi:putative hydrolase
MHGVAGYKETTEEAHTRAYVEAIKNPYVHIISHPVSMRRMFDIDAVVDAACKYNKLLELNNNAFAKHSEEPWLARMRKIVAAVQDAKHKLIINSDAHMLHELGDDSAVMRYQKRLGLKPADVINNYPEELKACLQMN